MAASAASSHHSRPDPMGAFRKIYVYLLLLNSNKILSDGTWSIVMFTGNKHTG